MRGGLHGETESYPTMRIILFSLGDCEIIGKLFPTLSVFRKKSKSMCIFCMKCNFHALCALNRPVSSGINLSLIAWTSTMCIFSIFYSLIIKKPSYLFIKGEPITWAKLRRPKLRNYFSPCNNPLSISVKTNDYRILVVSGQKNKGNELQTSQIVLWSTFWHGDCTRVGARQGRTARDWGSLVGGKRDRTRSRVCSEGHSAVRTSHLVTDFVIYPSVVIAMTLPPPTSQLGIFPKKAVSCLCVSACVCVCS